MASAVGLVAEDLHGSPAARPPRAPTPGAPSPSWATAGDPSFNRAALREREWLASKLEAPLQHVVGPPPLHDFRHDNDDVFDRVPKSGVPGRRLLRLPVDVAPQHSLACENEPEGPRTNPDSVEKVLEERGGLLVYRCTFQDLPPDTPAAVIQRLDRPRVDTAPGQENPAALRPFYAPESADDTVLVFESRFESGNLHSAHQVAPFEYDLKLSADTNTNGHTQWFYFSVSNTRKGISYKFNITNMLKSDSLYNHGLKPLIYSLGRQRQESMGWHRTGEQILYYSNNISAARKRGTCCYTLTFTVVFPHDHDTCYLTHCFPYTYYDLQTYLDQLELNPECRSFVRRKVLCETEAGNKCDVLTITSRSGDDIEMKNRKGVIISARVHPGETNASWMMKGCIDFLLSDKEEACQLRRKFVFKIVPMLCPDGVINGNYRCGIAGHDMNRRWAKPHPKQHSPIFHMKLMIEEMMEERQVVLFCDLHGHSRKKNVFLYGCDARFWNRKLSPGPTPLPLSERVFPLLMDEKSQSFAFRSCRFKVQKSKSSTGRVVCWRQMGIHNSYTVEASFCSADSGDQVGMHFDIPELESVGKCLCLTILEQFGGANQDTLLERVQSESLAQVDDGDSDSDDSSSDDEVVPVKTPSKAKISKNVQARSPERPSSVAETPEKDVIKEPVQTITIPSSRRLQPRPKCARTNRTGSHRRLTLSARARTAEPRNSDSMTVNNFKDKLRDWDVIPKAHVFRETTSALRDSSTSTAQLSGSSICTLDANPLTPEEPRSVLPLPTVLAEDKAETLRDKKALLQKHFMRRAQEIGEQLRWRPPRGASREDKTRPSPLQGLQDLQRMADKNLQVQAPNKIVHTLLFTADLPEESSALRRPLGTFPSRQNQQNFRSPSPRIAPPSPDLSAAPPARVVQRPSTAHARGRGELGLRGDIRRISSPDLRPSTAHARGRVELGLSEHIGRISSPDVSSPDLRELGRIERMRVLTASPTAAAVSSKVGGGQGDDDDAGLRAGAAALRERASFRSAGENVREVIHGGNSFVTPALSGVGGDDPQAAHPGSERRSRISREIDFIRAKVAQTVDLRNDVAPYESYSALVGGAVARGGGGAGASGSWGGGVSQNARKQLPVRTPNSSLLIDFVVSERRSRWKTVER